MPGHDEPPDPLALREYVVRRLGEAREIERNAHDVVVQLEALLAEPHTLPDVRSLRWEEWAERRRWALRHIGYELDVLALMPIERRRPPS